VKKFYLSAVICLLPFIVFSADAETKLSLRDSVTQALSGNNSYNSMKSKAAESQAVLDEAWGALWPTLASDASYSKSGSTESIDSLYLLNIVNCTISLNPGVFYNTIMAARDDRIIAENNLRVSRAEIEKSVIKLFYNLILTRETVKIQTESINSLKENLKTVTRAYELGRVSRLDYLTAKLTLTNSETDLINAVNDAETALAELNINLGNEADLKIDPDNSFSEIPSGEKQIMVFDSEKWTEFINKLVAESMKNRPELIIKKKTVEKYEHNMNVESATYLWPSFFANGKYSKSRNPDPGISSSSGSMDQWSDSWSVALGATYRWGAIAPWDSSHSARQQQEEKKKQAQYDLDDFIKQITLDVMKNYSAMRAAYNSILAQKDNVIIAEENMKVAKIQFRSGVIANSKFLDANIQLIKTKQNYIHALVSYSLAKSSLNNVLGSEYFNLY